MVSDQHKKIAGYRDLREDEIANMNAVKKMEAAFNGLIDALKELPGVDQRQVALAATHGEEAFMHAVRAIAKPDRIVTPVSIYP